MTGIYTSYFQRLDTVGRIELNHAPVTYRNVVPVETATKAPADNIVEERSKYRGDTGHSAKQTRSFRMLEAYLTETEAQEAALAQQQAGRSRQ